MLVVSLMLDFQHELSQTLDPALRSPHHLGCPRIKTLRLTLKIRNQTLFSITFLLRGYNRTFSLALRFEIWRPPVYKTVPE